MSLIIVPAERDRYNWTFQSFRGSRHYTSHLRVTVSFIKQFMYSHRGFWQVNLEHASMLLLKTWGFNSIKLFVNYVCQFLQLWGTLRWAFLLLIWQSKFSEISHLFLFWMQVKNENRHCAMHEVNCKFFKVAWAWQFAKCRFIKKMAWRLLSCLGVFRAVERSYTWDYIPLFARRISIHSSKQKNTEATAKGICTGIWDSISRVARSFLTAIPMLSHTPAQILLPCSPLKVVCNEVWLRIIHKPGIGNILIKAYVEKRKDRKYW